MMQGNVYDVLLERGYIEQATHADEIREMLGNEKVTFYIGFDPTADSLHVGHFVQLMVMRTMQKYGHQPIVLLGGGTTMVGDPSGKTDMRKMMTQETIAQNAECFKVQMARFLDFGPGGAIMRNNADWLLNLNYIELLRDVGAMFSVNRMLSAECYKARMANDGGLTFLEFNYMIMQAYDFLHLYKTEGCKMEFGGNDQWSNILAGVELVRRKEGGRANGLTFKLLTTSEGKKMGKTEKGALWLDPNKTTPYEFFQYWRNVEDADVQNCLALLTELPMDEVRRLGALKDKEINTAKEVLAFEVTRLVHGEEEAKKAMEASRALFAGGADSANIPTFELKKETFGEGMDIISLLREVKLIASNSEGRRLIEQKGITVDGEVVGNFADVIGLDRFNDNAILVRKGKKVYLKVVLVD